MPKKEIKDRQRQVLLGIKSTIEKSNADFVDVHWPDDTENNKIENYVWIGTKDSLIGNEYCHYEFIFNDDNEEHLSVEVHFHETEKHKYFEPLIQNLPDFLKTKDWEPEYDSGFRRIVHSNENDLIGIDETDDINRIAKKAIALLTKLDKAIGMQLRGIILKNEVLQANPMTDERAKALLEYIRNKNNLPDFFLDYVNPDSDNSDLLFENLHSSETRAVIAECNDSIDKLLNKISGQKRNGANSSGKKGVGDGETLQQVIALYNLIKDFLGETN